MGHGSRRRIKGERKRANKKSRWKATSWYLFVCDLSSAYYCDSLSSRLVLDEGERNIELHDILEGVKLEM